MKTPPVLIIPLIFCLFLVSACNLSTNNEKWLNLFNGKDLTGWTPKITGYPLGENFGNTFRVEDGVLKVSFDEYDSFNGRFGHLFYKTPYAHYRLRLEYRFVGEQAPDGPGWAYKNSGIMIHGQSPESMRQDQDFPVSIEVQLLGGHETGERPTANVCTPGTHIVMDEQLITEHCTNSTSDTFRGDQWISVELEVRGHGIIRHMINGDTVLTYTQSQLDETEADAKVLIETGQEVNLSGGFISLQSESHPIEFRNIELMELKENE